MNENDLGGFMKIVWANMYLTVIEFSLDNVIFNNWTNIERFLQFSADTFV